MWSELKGRREDFSPFGSALSVPSRCPLLLYRCLFFFSLFFCLSFSLPVASSLSFHLCCLFSFILCCCCHPHLGYLCFPGAVVPFPFARPVWESWYINLWPSAGGGTNWLVIAINAACVCGEHVFLSPIWEMWWISVWVWTDRKCNHFTTFWVVMVDYICAVRTTTDEK